jgi:hypothetical protein
MGEGFRIQTDAEREDQAVTEYWKRRSEVMDRLGIAVKSKARVWLKSPRRRLDDQEVNGA